MLIFPVHSCAKSLFVRQLLDAAAVGEILVRQEHELFRQQTGEAADHGGRHDEFFGPGGGEGGRVLVIQDGTCVVEIKVNGVVMISLPSGKS